MSKFVLDPYVGALPIRIEMSPQDVARVIGAPERARTNALRIYVEQRSNLVIGYSGAERQMLEIVFWPGSSLNFHDVDLFCLDDPIAFLRRFDPDPFACLGMVGFRDLGIRVTGYHDGDESQRAIGVVRKGYWDDLWGSCVPYPSEGHRCG